VSRPAVGAAPQPERERGASPHPVGHAPRPLAQCAAVDEHCITCADEGTPMRVTALDLDAGLAHCVDGGGAGGEVETALVGAVVVGDCLLVHAGTAIARIESGAFA
jgi:hydrogenase maturation factor